MIGRLAPEESLGHNRGESREYGGTEADRENCSFITSKGEKKTDETRS